MDWREYITVGPNVCRGEACIASTRVVVTLSSTPFGKMATRWLGVRDEPR